jgi:hypothetical protein
VPGETAEALLTRAERVLAEHGITTGKVVATLAIPQSVGARTNALRVHALD